ncbi:MAG TPA: TolC family protein [Pyrinomonadaceae bacterium]|nr:TolC family protein [Pyrinomonadaceae bacterium]
MRAQRSALPITFQILICALAAAPATSYAQLIKSENTPNTTARSSSVGLAPTGPGFPQTSSTAKQPITVSDAVSIFLRQNFQLIAARYDIDTAEAEKLTARLRPNPEVSVGFEGLPLNLHGNPLTEQQYTYSISQTFELGGKRGKRISVADANAEVARAQFETVLWQLTNDVKRKFFTVILAKSLLDLATQNEATFEDVVKHTSELVQAGEVSGLDLTRLEVEKLKFDTDLASAQRDYEVALRDLRVTLGGDYRTMEIEPVGSLDPETYNFTFADLRDKALAARPDLKAAKLSEQAADQSIRLQDAQRIPDLNLEGGITQVPGGGSNFTYGVGMTLPVHDRNQGERAKARIEREKAQNQQHLITNQIFGDVDKALVAFEIQKRRVDLYNTGVITKVNKIQDLTEYSLKAGESSILDLLDAIRTRRETLAGFYQTLFDYESALLDLELATATRLQK